MLERIINDEKISLTDFILTLWNGKWILFFSILSFILISHIFLYFNNSFKGIIKIETIDSNEENKYEIYKIAQILYFGKLEENLKKYNSFITDETLIKGEKYSDVLFLSFDRNHLLEKFIEQIKNISLNTSRIKNIILTSNFLNDEELLNAASIYGYKYTNLPKFLWFMRYLYGIFLRNYYETKLLFDTIFGRVNELNSINTKHKNISMLPRMIRGLLKIVIGDPLKKHKEKYEKKIKLHN